MQAEIYDIRVGATRAVRGFTSDEFKINTKYFQIPFGFSSRHRSRGAAAHGRPRGADAVHAMSLANLHGEYCTVLTVADLLALSAAPPESR